MSSEAESPETRRSKELEKAIREVRPFPLVSLRPSLV